MRLLRADPAALSVRGRIVVVLIAAMQTESGEASERHEVDGKQSSPLADRRVMPGKDSIWQM
ncbi:MAG: hypothetical protein ACYCPD_01365 [Acidobacteriaceae bacterium]